LLLLKNKEGKGSKRGKRGRTTRYLTGRKITWRKRRVITTMVKAGETDIRFGR